MKTKILFFISFVLAILLISLVSSPTAQVVIAPQPYINSSGVAVGPISIPDGSLAAPGLFFAGQSTLGFSRPATGTITIGGGGTLQPLLQFGGTSSLFPAFRRNAAAFEFVLADSSAYAQAIAQSFSVQATGNFFWVGSTVLGASANKLLQINDSANLTGAEFNVGTPTLGTCTGGSLVSGAHNFGGEITGNTSGSCVLNFGTPNFTNTPFCALNDETSLVAARVSARSASSITITGLTSGDAVQYICVGRIGT